MTNSRTVLEGSSNINQEIDRVRGTGGLGYKSVTNVDENRAF